MSQYDNDNTLVLFVNDYKAPGSNQPDYKGKATVGGVEFKCSGWKKEGKNTGSVYLSVKLTPSVGDEVGVATAAPATTPRSKPKNNDDIPF